MDSEGPPAIVPAPALPSPTPTRHRRGWRRFLTKRFLFASLALHMLLAIGAARWAVQSAPPARVESPVFTARPSVSNAATQAIEHKVKIAQTKSTMSAPPALRRVLSQRPAKTALPEVPAMPAMPAMPPTLVAGTNPAMGAGFGLPAHLASGVGGGGSITRFIGGLRVTARKLGVALDISGSVHDYQQAMRAYVASAFKGSEISELTSAGFYAVQSPRASMGSVVLDFLKSPQKFDAIYIFSDFGETREKIPAGHEDLWPEVQRLIREKQTRLYLHVLRKPDKEDRINAMLDTVIQFARSTGGSVKIGPMTQIESGSAEP